MGILSFKSKEIAFEKIELIPFVYVKSGMEILKKAEFLNQMCFWSWSSCTIIEICLKM